MLPSCVFSSSRLFDCLTSVYGACPWGCNSCLGYHHSGVTAAQGQVAGVFSRVLCHPRYGWCQELSLSLFLSLCVRLMLLLVAYPDHCPVRYVFVCACACQFWLTPFFFVQIQGRSFRKQWMILLYPPPPTCCFPFILISPLSNPVPSLTHSSPSTLTSNLHARGPISLQCDIPRQNQQTQLVLPCGLDSLCSFSRLCHLLRHWSNLQTA